MDDNENDKLRKENDRLKQAIRRLTIEKNKLEDQLYRAFWKCLNAKKRKIAELERKLKGDSNNNNKRAKLVKPKVMVISDSNSEDDDDESWKKKYEEDSEETSVDDDNEDDEEVIVRNIASPHKKISKPSSSSEKPNTTISSNSDKPISSGISTSTDNARAMEQDDNIESESSQSPECLPFLPKDSKVAKQIKEGSSSSNLNSQSSSKNLQENSIDVKTGDNQPTVPAIKDAQEPSNSQDSNSTCYDLDELISECDL